MAGSTVAFLLFGLAVVAALPQTVQRNTPYWPDRPSFWPENLPWPPSSTEGWPDRPIWWPFPTWPPPIPDQWPAQPDWWPENLPWPPTRPSLPEDAPEWWPDLLPWPPTLPSIPEDAPEWWPENLPWPPTLPSLPEDPPLWWPENLPWPPQLPSLPDQWPDRPVWWPESLPWPPQLPDIDTIWPPPGVNPDIIPYVPSRDNEFHLFTRANPSWSQPLLFNNADILRNSNYDGSKRTVILVHDIRGSATAVSNAILVPAFLAAADVNIIAVDWSVGAHSSDALSTIFSVLSGNFVSRFVRFVLDTTDGDLDNFHLVGVGLGGLNVGFIGIRLNRQVGYITALDPSGGPDIFRLLPALSPNVAKYSESIHTDTSNRGLPQQIAHASFYPNGGAYQLGCGGDSECNRLRAVFFFAESIQTGGFSSVQCANWRDALEGNCHGPGRSNLGGLEPKTGTRGVFWLRTNAVQPFSQG